MTIVNEGDIGDVILLAGIMSQLPEAPHRLLFKKSKWTKIRTDKDLERLIALVKPLIETMPWISDCREQEPNEFADWDHGTFRRGYVPGKSLISSQLDGLLTATGKHINFDYSAKWIEVEPSDESSDRIISARSSRYHNDKFPWKEIVEKYGDRLMFIGTQIEHRDFCREFGRIEHRKTDDMLEVAELIAGSLLFIGNQSSPNAVCEGLKHDSIQEVCLHYPDCIYKRPNAQFCYNRNVTLPGFDGDEPLVLSSDDDSEVNIDVHECIAPPGLWQYPGYPAANHFEEIKALVAKGENISREEARVKILTHNVKRRPDFFGGVHSDFTNVKLAMQAAGISA